MKLALKAAALIPLFVLACSDDDKDATPKNTGVFVDSPVAGLHYKAGGYEGDTNAAGEFRYDDGDVVEFSVGGVVIGSAPGAARVTPFDLFAASPPLTEASVYDALEITGVVSGFQKAINVAAFLQAFDADGNPTNGIDVSAAAAVLAGKSLSFNEHPDFFTDHLLLPLIAESAQGRLDITARAAAAHLYASLSLPLTASALASYAEDNDNDGTIDRTEAYTYDATGRSASTVITNAAGVVTYRSTFEYDARGRLSKTTVQSDFVAEVAQRESVTTMTYDQNTGLEVGSVEETRVAGILIGRVENTRQRNVYGSVTIEESRNDGDGDGVFDSLLRRQSDYDAANRVVELTGTGFSDLGVTVGSRYSVTSTYDAVGNETVRVYENDGDGDGEPEQVETTTTTYDALRRPSTRRHDSDYLVETDETEIVTFTYADDGQISKIVTDYDSGADGSFEVVITTDITYDDNRRKTREYEDGVNGGAIHNLRITDFTYDAAGNRTKTTLTINQNSQANPEPDEIVETTQTYNADNYELTLVQTRDASANGSIDEQFGTVKTYTPVTDVYGYVFMRDGTSR